MTTHRIVLLIKILAGVGALVYLGYSGALSFSIPVLGAREVVLLLLGTLVLFASSFVCFIRWGVFLDGVKFSRVWSLSMISTFMNIYLPGGVGGDVVRGVLVGGKLSKLQGLMSVGADRGIAIVALVVMAAVLAAMDPALASLLARVGGGLWLIPIALILVGLIVFIGPRLSLRLRALFEPWESRPLVWLWTFLLSLLSHALNFAGVILYWCVLDPQGWSNPEVLKGFLSHVPIALAMAGIPALPGGVGVGHAAFEWVLGDAGISHSANLYTLYALQLFLLGLIGWVYFLKEKIPLGELLRYTQKSGDSKLKHKA